jgi:hypothetical protein
MKKSNLAKISGLGLLMVSIIAAVAAYQILEADHRSTKVTFAACEQAGGQIWRVDLFDPDVCPTCAEYADCLEEHPQAEDIRQVCPSTIPCGECMEANFPYPDRCPGDREVIGQISDAATWFLCCEVDGSG